MVIQNIAQYSKKHFDLIVAHIRYTMPALKRSDLILKSEIAFHIWCYKHNLWTIHTKDLDIDYKLTFKEWVCYHTLGLLILAILSD